MQLAFAALAKVGASLGLSSAAAASSAATAATTAATTATTAAATTSTSLGALQGFATTLSVLGQLGSGLMAAQQSRQMATEAELQSGQEQVAGTQRTTAMKRELARVLANNDVAFAAAGIDLSGGIAANAATEAKKRAVDEISIDQQDTEFRRALLKMRASGYRQQAGMQIGGALLGALGTGVNYGLDLKERG